MSGRSAIGPLFMVALCAGAQAATIGATGASPSVVPAGVATPVTFTAQITDPTLITASVNLQQLNGAGQATVVGSMRDDGQNGDAVAGDGIYSFRTTVNQQSAGILTYRVSAGFRGTVARALSPAIGVTVSSISITSPASAAYLSISPTTVTGTVSSGPVTVNGIAAQITGGTFSASVPLQEGSNVITAVAQGGSGPAATASVTVTLDTTPPHVTIVSPAEGAVTSDSTVSVSGIVNDIVVGTVNPQQATVTVNGVTAQVSNRTFVASGVTLQAGANAITATARDRAGNFATTSVNVTKQSATQPTLKVISGNGQTGNIRTQLAGPLVVQALNAAGQPIPNTPVVFQVTMGDGLVGTGAPGLPAVAVNTNAQGQAQVNFSLGSHAGAGNNSVQASTVGIPVTPVFTETATTTTPTMIVVDSGNNQTGATGQSLPLPFIAIVTDAGHNRLSGVPVTFKVTSGGGNIGGQTTVQTNSDSDGRVQAVLTVGPQDGINNNVVTADFAGNAGLPATFTATGQVAGAASATTISGVVLDNSNLPIPGVSMRLYQVNNGTAGNVPQQVAPTVTTSAQGTFTIPSAPVGVFKLMADGSTATRPGPFPTLEYDMITVSGRNNTVGLPIFLPQLSSAGQLCVSLTSGGVLTNPQAPGFSLKIAAGSATFPGGSKSGCVTVTPVNMDKMPMVPGFGQQPRFIVTIQPVGTTFSPPAAITIPNVDGLAPRAVTEMYSYDHDLASFVSIGTGTVSADGSVIVSDPGVGVLKAGWHCGGDPNANGTVADCPDCQICQGNKCVKDPAKEGTACQTNKVCRDGNCVCAIPTNFRQTGTSDAGGGTLHFDYLWDSSTGHLEDLSNCTISEKVDYNAAELPFPSPPFPAGLSPNNPTILTVPGTDGAAQDNHSTPGTFVKPYRVASVTATQNYRYTCACASGGNPVVINGPLTILRSVSQNPDGSWRFTITKSGSSATINPLPN